MKNFLILIALSFFSIGAFAQNKFTISGGIKDDAKGEEIISARVKVKDQPIGTNSNEYGFFSMTLPEGKYTLVVSAYGFVTQEIEVNLNQNVQLSVQMKNPVEDAVMGVERLDPKELSKLPVLLGEKDIIKTMQLLPGVKNAGEGSSGFYVRGGGADQNLILLDEAPVYNASHLLGFFSTFNSDAIKDATLYKGNQPANFGGRLSSVLDIKMNEGNNKKFNVSGGLGLISSKLNVEGPIVKDKASFLVTGRRTYADVFLKATDRFKDNKLYFYDLNTKLNYRISKKDRIYLSGYFGRDKLGFGETFGIDWGNATATARWNRIVNEKLFSNTSFIFSSYDYKISIKSGDVDFKVLSKIQDFNLKQEFQYFLNTRNKLRFGLNAIHHAITPGQVEANSDSGFSTTKINPLKSIESAIYITNDWTASEKINVSYGARLTGFSVLGNGSESYTFDENGDVATTNTYKKNQMVKTYLIVEPRVSASYSYSKTASIKAAYARNAQNIHLLSNATSASPTDVWLSTTLNTKPEIADQASIGWFKNFKENAYEFNLETYYKTMQNQIDYRNGANTQANEKLEGELLYGIGRAYGLEMILKKKTGKLTGWIGYTLSKTERKINGINENNWYVAKQDRTHDVSVVGIYDINKKLSVSALFVFYTGNAVTFPTGKYEVNGETQFSYTERNAARMPNYHRLDLGVTWIRKNTEKFESSWNFSVYNAYARENAYQITFRQSESDPNKTEAVQTTLFRIVPAVTWNFKFK
jgi:hypothetical protein